MSTFKDDPHYLPFVEEEKKSQKVLRKVLYLQWEYKVYIKPVSSKIYLFRFNGIIMLASTTENHKKRKHKNVNCRTSLFSRLNSFLGKEYNYLRKEQGGN